MSTENCTRCGLHIRERLLVDVLVGLMQRPSPIRDPRHEHCELALAALRERLGRLEETYSHLESGIREILPRLFYHTGHRRADAVSWDAASELRNHCGHALSELDAAREEQS